MLRPVLSTVGFIVTLASLGMAVPAAVAAEPVSCPEGFTLETRTQKCVLAIRVPPPPGQSGGAPGNGGPVSEVSACLHRGTEVPCERDGGWWSNDRSCYVKLVEPQPPLDDPIWQGQQEGGIYLCTDLYGLFPTRFWSQSQPAGPGAPVDPGAVAQTIVTQMELRAIEIGMVPEEGPDSMGVVGLPVWMWVADRGEQTFGPMTRSASLGGVTVTATARVERIWWEMGDGGAVTCWTAGTPFTDGHGGESSPDCGYTYTRQGTYTVRATSFWSVDWTSSTGVSGSIPLQVSRERLVRIGEIQVVRR